MPELVIVATAVFVIGNRGVDGKTEPTAFRESLPVLDVQQGMRHAPVDLALSWPERKASEPVLQRGDSRSQPEGLTDARRIALADDPGTAPDLAFAAGYQAFGGREEWLPHFEALGFCEGGEEWAGYHGENGYLSRFQFDPGSWATASGITGLPDFDDPYSVGAAVAVWSNLVGPASNGGWPVCWRRTE